MSDIDYQEIIKTVVERGSMTRNELLDEWGLDAEQYSELRKRVRSHPEVRPKRGRVGGIETIVEEEEAVGVVPSNGQTWTREDVARLFELLLTCRSMSRELVYSEMDLDEPDEYKAFLDELVKYAASQSHVLARKRGRGGIELKASPEEIYQRLRDRPDRSMTSAEIKAASGWEYRAFVADLQRIAEEDGQRLIRHKGKKGVTLAKTYGELVTEIATTGRMARAEILEKLGLEAEDYPRVIESLYFAAREHGIELDRAQGRGGGFSARVVARDSTEPTDAADAPTPERFELEPWQQAAVQILIEVGPAKLEEFVGPALYNTIRAVEKSRSSYARAWSGFEVMLKPRQWALGARPRVREPTS